MADRVEREGDWLKPHLSERALQGVVHQATVALPVRATGAFQLTDMDSGLSVDVALVGARDVPAETAEGFVVYRGVHVSGADVVQRRTAEGTEDYVAFERAPAVPELGYEIALGEKVAGVRLVSNTVELLDAGGAPRLRMAPPYVVDASGERREASVAVSGCAYDADPRAPWERPVTAPGAARCAVHVAWGGVGVGYPALVDPVWSSTGMMTTARAGHTASVLSSGKVLVAGGYDGIKYLASAEIYDTTTGTWSPTGPLTTARSIHTASVLSSGKVLVAGGSGSSGYLVSAEVYNPATGSWSPTAPLVEARDSHTASVLKNGNVLVAGGYGVNNIYLPTAEVYDQTMGSWSQTGFMTTRRCCQSASVISSGKVLLVGGLNDNGMVFPTSLASAETYDPTTNSWNPTGPLAAAHSSHTASVLASGKVLVAGGGGTNGNFAEVYDPTTDSWSPTSPLATARSSHTASVLSSGRVLVTGGYKGIGYLASAEVYDPTTGSWSPTSPLATARSSHTASVLASGKVLIAGGGDNNGHFASAELFTLLSPGSTCASSGECAFSCVDNICCSTACSGLCQACSVAKTGVANGTCAAVKAGTDPDNECASLPASSCSNDGFCNGAGACQLYLSGTVCVPPSCSNSTLTSPTCDGVGSCLPHTASCSPYTCADGSACATACAADGQCVQTSYCRSMDSTCQPDRPNGLACATASQCESGNCVDGTCCDAPCNGLCQACSAAKTDSAEGVCAPVTTATDPDNECLADAPSTCQHDGFCDGSGACRNYLPGVPCGAMGCVNNTPAAYACNGGGTCVSNPTALSCKDYLCRDGACTTGCTTSVDCAPTALCNAGTCQAKTATGTPCATKDECATGQCADGLCCDQACTGQCEACDVTGAEGICVPVAGEPHGARAACSPAMGDNPCSKALCDGVERAACDGRIGSSVSCRAPSCTEGVASLDASCDGKGNCPAAITIPCAPFGCDTKACKTSCAEDLDCAPSYRCEGGKCLSGATCDGDHKVTTAEGKPLDCAPFKCEGNGMCRSTCGSVDDCVVPSVCDQGGNCVAPPTGGSTVEGVGCALSRSRSAPSGAWLGVLALAGLAGLRRARARKASASPLAWPRWIGLLMATLAILVGCSTDSRNEVDSVAPPRGSAPTSMALPESSAARAVLAAMRERFPRPAEILAPSFANGADGVDRDGAWLHPRLPDLVTREALHRATVALSARADGVFRLTDVNSGLAVEVALVGATSAPGETTSGFVVYRQGHTSGADVVHRPTAEGTEDFLYFERAPEAPELGYEIMLSEKVAGVRLVSNTVELLDAGGAPRLRMAPPYVVDASGERREASVAVSGCAYDADPRTPWGRPVTAPGATRCAVHVAWGGVGVRYPALVDPVWSSTGMMTTARDDHTASVLSSGKVLVAGGYGSSGVPLASAEVYDPSTGSWSPTGPLTTARYSHTASVLVSGKVLVAGGSGSSWIEFASAEVYDPTTGSWSPTGSLSNPRASHTASVLSNGRVLVACGYGPSPFSWFVETAELYDPTTGSWSPMGSLSYPRASHTASILPSGKVLVAGGRGPMSISNPSGYLVSAQVYDPATGSWSATSSLATPRSFHTASVLVSGKVLVAGGDGTSGLLKSTEVYDPATGSWSLTSPLATARTGHRASALSSGRVLVTGGYDGIGYLASTEVYDPATSIWSSIKPLLSERSSHTASVLASGKVLVAGGANSSGYLASAELFTYLSPGSACTSSGECAFSCIDNVCCSTACTGLCQACIAAKTGVADGICAPVTAGTDPQNDCAILPASSCSSNGFCDGAGACQLHVSGTACVPPSCSKGTLTTPTCNGLGSCLPHTTSCAPYICANGSACATACVDDGQCVPTNYCRSADSTCQPDEPNGLTCTSASQCQSGNCVDGTCCNAPCNGLCQACSVVKTGSADGVCAPVSTATDPDNECSADAASTCQHDGFCDGSGACRNYISGTPCSLASCVANVPVGQVCNGFGSCLSNPNPQDCGEYLCTDGACLTTCATAADCAPTAWCDAGTCLPKIVAGQPCTAKDACSTGLCADGVCCNAPCLGQCEACDVAGAAGTCLPVSDSPHGTRAACAAGTTGDPCSEKVCDGIERTTCNGFVGSTVSCRAASCTDGIALLSLSCDGHGNCPAPGPSNTKTCEPFGCAADACKTICAADADCALGFRCEASMCLPGACNGDHTVLAGDKTIDCSPFKCEPQGGCKSRCTSVDDCAAPNGCNSLGTCVAPLSTGNNDQGSGCGLASSPPATPAAWLALLVLAGLAYARRRPMSYPALVQQERKSDVQHVRL